MVFWVSSATGGPSLGPLIAGFSVVYGGWRWSLWILLWLTGPTFILLFLFLPKTSANNILLRRAARLRKVTGNPNFKSQSEIDQSKLTAKQVLVEALYRPFQIEILDPSVLFVTVYSSLTYGLKRPIVKTRNRWLNKNNRFTTHSSRLFRWYTWIAMASILDR